jgi:3-hydroxyacyl-CoA dehydrogenase/enoyl-CoA hydratase/3-hydroxybutyryl-CoA epimerase/enoyl-CoA isomerase
MNIRQPAFNSPHYTGQAFSVSFLDVKDSGGTDTRVIAQVCFDLQGAPVNVFNQSVFDELHLVLDQLEDAPELAGVIFTSGKSVFVAGAEIPALLAFGKADDVTGIHKHVMSGQSAFSRIEALPVPTVAAINGVALGGGLEFALASDARVMSERAKVGLPEVNLGLFPGYAGTVRLPRMIDPVTAMQWISTGKPQSAQSALDAGLVARVCDAESLLDVAISELDSVATHMTEIRARKQQKVTADDTTRKKLDQISVGLDVRPGPNYPAASLAMSLVVNQLDNPAEQAGLAEARAFADILTSPTAINLLSVFMNEQAVARVAKRTAAGARSTDNVAVIGAGIMGGGIAYQSSLKGIGAVLKDIQPEALEAGMNEAIRNFSTQVAKGRLSEKEAQLAQARISPTLDSGSLSDVDLVVEAVVENTAIKQSVLKDLEAHISSNCVLTSNTSTISITRLAQGLSRPEQFCGLHFFNPVPAMPLVEIIRGKKTSDTTIATTVQYALQLGKNPIVVNDSPGFLVNRVLFPYIIAAQMLIAEGVDFRQIDEAMQSWGWPMGPAYLSDVIGLDTMTHCLDVMAADIPQRMAPDYMSAIHTLHSNARLGQKSRQGFYHYARNEAGGMTKQQDELALGLIYLNAPSEINYSEIQERLTLAFCFETIRCLEEGVVASAAEADMALLWGLGFPRFRGGALQHVDTVGIAAFCAMAEGYAHLGPLYEIPQLLEKMRKSGTSFYG